MIHYHIYHVPNFEEHKQKIIDLINKIPSNPLNDGDKISHQDYEISKDSNKEYQEYFQHKIFIEFASSLCKFLGSDGIQLTKIWFQVYKKGDFHGIHSHANTNLTNVFYLNLPNTEIKTEIFLPKDKFSLDVNEGDILTFPAYYPHRSPMNTFEDDKIIIGFNIDTIHGRI